MSIENDRIVEISEKPEEAENPMINTGIYVFDPKIFDYLGSMEGEKDLTYAVQLMIEDERCHFELVEDYWIDIGSPKKLWKADQTKREYSINSSEISDEAEVAENVQIKGEAIVEKDVELKPGTVIEGKVFIGKGSVVGPNTVLRDCSIGERSQIRSAEIDSAVLFEENIVDPFVHLEQVVIGEECDIKSNTTIRESFIGPRSFVEMNNSIRGVKFVPDARTDLGEISK